MPGLPRTAPATLFLGLVGVAAVGGLDYVTGFELRLFPLYFLPITYVAWRGTRRWTAVAALLSAAAWALSNWSAGRVYSHAYIWPINATSQLVAFITVGLLVVELRRRLLIAEDLMRQDALTALLNRRGFEERGALLLAVARRGARPVTFAYLDLDGFKALNDRDGHAAGDRALQAVAAVLTRELRASDLVARLGGDEFAVMLPDTGGAAARTALERVLARLQAELARNGWSVTASVGGLAYDAPPPSIAEALTATDARMYRAKQRGKAVLEFDVIAAA